jgi:tetratricopeptide (TPR) repeat protein
VVARTSEKNVRLATAPSWQNTVAAGETRVVSSTMRRRLVLAAFFGAAIALSASLVVENPGLAFAVLGAWALGEWLIPRWLRRRRFHGGPTVAIPEMLLLFRRSDPQAEVALAEKINRLALHPTAPERDRQSLERLQALVRLRALAFGAPEQVHALRSAFVFVRDAEADSEVPRSPLCGPDLSNLAVGDVESAGIVVSDLYWKLLDACEGKFPELTRYARRLFQDLFGIEFEADRAKRIVSALSDAMLFERGVAFAVLNLHTRGRKAWARALAQAAVVGDFPIDEDVRSTLYWLCELDWFQRHVHRIDDFDGTMRHLVHLCFTQPDRTGFLEIDSRFFSQFDTVNEVAREAFHFKESLVENALGLWGGFEGLFDGLFASTLEALTRRRGKLSGERDGWVAYWTRSKDTFEQEYQFVVEGNLSYAAGHWAQAKKLYERALALNPALRAARMNLVFCEARLGDRRKHRAAVEALVATDAFLPTALYVAGDSYLLLGDEAEAERYYAELSAYEGWERKADYYKSTFCSEHGLPKLALKYAERAFLANPHDPATAFQLSLCHGALGDAKKALELLRDGPLAGSASAEQWLHFYRFTLERDAGLTEAALQTLRQIPPGYFDDPAELEAALEFARARGDLALLRHLRDGR